MIGGVKICKENYCGSDLYSDGDIEDKLLLTVKERAISEELNNGDEWAILYHFSEIRENLLEWFPFREDADILEVGSGCGAITGLLSKKAKSVTCIDLSYKRSLINAYRNYNKDNISILVGNFADISIDRQYDYITLIGVLEYAALYLPGNDPYVDMLKKLQQHLKPNGIIIIGIENKCGFKYWNGAVEDHNGIKYSGLNDYVNIKGARTFSKPEMEYLLSQSGIISRSFFYPMQDYKLPDSIYSDKFLPKAGDLRYYGQNYDEIRKYNFNDAIVSDQICKDGIFDYFANSFLIVCGQASISDIYTKYSFDRKPEFRIVTRIKERNNKRIVIKEPMCDDAVKHIKKMKRNEEVLRGTMKKMVFKECISCDMNYVMEYIEGKDVEEDLFVYRNDGVQFLRKLNEIINQWIEPNEEKMIDFAVSDEFVQVFGDKYPNNSYSLTATNIDIILSNIRIVSNIAVCYDIEWTFEFPIPYRYVIWRLVVDVYEKYQMYLKYHYSKESFLRLIGFNDEEMITFRCMEVCFNRYVYGDEKSRHYLNNYRKGVEK